MLMAYSKPSNVVSQAAAFLFVFTLTHDHTANKCVQKYTHRLRNMNIVLAEEHIDKYLKYVPAETLKLNWAELRQMRRSKLNKRSSLLGDSTMVIRVSCEPHYIIYGCAVGPVE